MSFSHRLHFGYPAKTLGEWLRLVEVANAPHTLKGLVSGWLGWVFGLLVWPGPHNAVWFAFGVSLAVAVLWEIRDYFKADGFDFLDVLFDLVGFGFGQLYHITTHWLD